MVAEIAEIKRRSTAQNGFLSGMEGEKCFEKK